MVEERLSLQDAREQRKMEEERDQYSEEMEHDPVSWKEKDPDLVRIGIGTLEAAEELGTWVLDFLVLEEIVSEEDLVVVVEVGHLIEIKGEDLVVELERFYQ